ncbi:MAG TPA: CBS domain-containing protein, partial [Desulfobacterales bacterium]|nr:CBS domain-containing protein [Desulfobacterales bacterium]
MKTVKDILRAKGSKVYSIPPDATVYEALNRMADKNVGALLVLEVEQIVGLISERDYARKTILKGRFSKETAVKEIMTTNVITVGPGEDLEECMELFTDKHVRHLPV